MDLKHRINQIKYYFGRYGFFETIKKCLKRILGIKDANLYTDSELYRMWIENNEPNEKELESLKRVKFDIEPLISVVVPMYNTNEQYFEELVASMENQIYKRWELCLADGSNEKNSKFEERAEKDNRIFYKFLGENKGISGNSNEALKMANGKYIALLDHDDLLPQTALFEFVKAINENNMPDQFYRNLSLFKHRYEFKYILFMNVFDNFQSFFFPLETLHLTLTFALPSSVLVSSVQMAPKMKLP